MGIVIYLHIIPSCRATDGWLRSVVKDNRNIDEVHGPFEYTWEEVGSSRINVII